MNILEIMLSGEEEANLRRQQADIAAEQNIQFRKQLSQIASDCSEFIQNTSRPLYRGILNKPGRTEVINYPIRQDRRPLSRSYAGTRIFNSLIEELFGVKNIRSRCLFATSSRGTATEYGTPYFVFPKNGSQLMSIPNQYDSIALLQELVSNYTLSDSWSKIPTRDRDILSYYYNQLSSDTESLNDPSVLKFDDLDKLSDEVKEKRNAAISDAKALMSNYKIVNTSSISDAYFSSDTEYMVYDIDSVYLVSQIAVNRAYGSDQAYSKLIESLRSLQ